eukprot:13910377-Alexandrium_andersonii.AAC.1
MSDGLASPASPNLASPAAPLDSPVAPSPVLSELEDSAYVSGGGLPEHDPATPVATQESALATPLAGIAVGVS